MLKKIPLILIAIVVFPATALAVPPPDFIFNVGSQIAQFFSIIGIFLAAIFTASYQYLKTKFTASSNKKFWITGGIFIVIILLASAYGYGQYRQQQEYEKWLTESKIKAETDLDQLKIGKEKIIPIEPKSEPQDPNTEFIRQYYADIASGNYEKAYNVSKKSADLDTFKSWYKDTTKITVDKITRIDEKKSSLELTLYEGESYTRYGVLMTLALQNGKPIHIEQSEVRILSSKNPDKGETAPAIPVQKNNTSISNKEFRTITQNANKNYIVLDARENFEYENGNFPGSLHIRFADLKAGRWIELPLDKPIYVFCWSGIRGKEVAEFLRTKGIKSYYLEEGANGWYQSGGAWNGSIKFSEKYSGEEYTRVFSTNEVKQKVAEGVKLVDSREPWKFEKGHIAGSVSIPILYTPTIKFEETFNQVPKNSKVIIICDGYVNCFDAKITGAELEKRGIEFLGRYNEPWKY